MSKASALSVAVIGLGFGAIHARVLSEMDGVDLVAVCDKDEGRLAVVARGRTLRPYTDYREMLRSERPDAVVVAVPTRLHEEVAVAAIETGAAVLVEKPIAPSLAEGRRLVAAAEKRGVGLMAGHIERFNPAVVELKKRVDGGEAGRVLQLSARRLGPFAARTRDVSVIHDLALHDIDAMRFVLGAEIVRVYAETQTGVRTAFEDSVNAVVRLEGAGLAPGAVGVLDVNWLTPKKVRQLWLLGERGLFVADYADLLAPTLEFHRGREGEDAGLTGRTWSTLANLRGRDPGVVDIPIEPLEPLEQELSAFVKAVATGGPMPVASADALAALAVADALAESGRTGMPVEPAKE